jgi:hypothetical protein
MRWGHSKRKARRLFALVPRPLMSGGWVWLEWVWSISYMDSRISFEARSFLAIRCYYLIPGVDGPPVTYEQASELEHVG